MTVEDRLVGALVDQHAQLRDLLRAAARARAGQRAEAVERLLRVVAVHVAAERVALTPPGESTSGRPEQDLVTAVELLEDLGAHGATSTVRLGVVAAALVRHARHGEEETVPRYVATHDEFDIRWAATALGSVPDLVAEVGPAAAVPVGVSFRQQLRAALDAVREALRHA
ncbi:hypothetical protein [Phycicoccus avicenniae]|uniref:hypothetical protein n=1 Tax=Phycicoccus avicenniae TaxID=2828860 RepID=UPI003D2B268C